MTLCLSLLFTAGSFRQLHAILLHAACSPCFNLDIVKALKDPIVGKIAQLTPLLTAFGAFNCISLLGMRAHFTRLRNELSHRIKQERGYISAPGYYSGGPPFLKCESYVNGFCGVGERIGRQATHNWHNKIDTLCSLFWVVLLGLGPRYYAEILGLLAHFSRIIHYSMHRF